jgi:hypothetical protein
LIDSLAALPGVRPVTTSTEGIEGGALVNGIEVARAAGSAPLLKRPVRKLAGCAATRGPE